MFEVMRLSSYQLGSLTEISSSRTWTPERLRTAIDTRARELSSFGLKERRSLLIERQNSIEFFVDFLACLSIGACAIPCDARLPQSRRQDLARELGPFAISSAQGALIMGPNPDRPRDAAFVLLTSGTSGKAKEIPHGFDGLHAKMESLAKAIPADDIARTLCALPTFFGHGLVCNSLFPLLTGKHLFIADPFMPALISELDEVIEREKITFFSTTPVIWSWVEQFAVSKPKPSLRRVHCASAPLDEKKISAMAAWAPIATLWNVYGLTEFQGWVSLNRIEPGVAVNDIGRPWDAESDVDTATGELMLRAPYQSPSLPGWYRTGDLVERDSRGHFLLKGRGDFVINKGGLKIQPEEIEALLATCPLVAETGCFAFADEALGQKIGLAVVPRDSAVFTREALLKWIAERAAAYKVPDRIDIWERLPRSSRGKLDRHAIKGTATDGQN